MTADVLRDALQYHALGWSILPIKPGTKKPALRSLRDVRRAPADEHTIRDWFAGRDDLGIAVWTGPASGGLTCRDFDIVAAYDAWRAAFPALAEKLPTVRTHRGCHVYAITDCRQIISRTDGEIRANGYCLLPPSVHPQGTPYRWLIPPDGTVPRLNLADTGFSLEWISEPAGSEAGLGVGTEHTEHTEQYRSNCSVCSVHSVCSVPASLPDPIEQAIVFTLPRTAGQRNRQVFEFARALKAIPALADADANELRPHVERWHAKALPVIRTKPFEETWVDFLIAWPRVKFPRGSEPLLQLFSQAAAGPLPVAAERYSIPELKLLVGLCAALQRASGAEPFYLACRTAGRLLGVPHTIAARWLQLLLLDKVLVCVTPGTKTKAARYRYVDT